MCEAIILQAASINNPEYQELVAHLYAQWENWDSNLFRSIFTRYELQPLIKIDSKEAIGGRGKFESKKHSKLERPMIWLCVEVINGQEECLQNGDHYYNGRILYLKDIMLHEMIHQFQHEIVYTPGTGLNPEQNLEWGAAMNEEKNKCGNSELFRSHGIVFTKKANEIAIKLGLPEVCCECETDTDRLAQYGGILSSEFPICCRSSEYYEGAHMKKNS